MTCEPDCLACHYSRLMSNALRERLHKECGAWRVGQKIDAHVATALAAVMWQAGETYGREQTMEFAARLSAVRAA